MGKVTANSLVRKRAIALGAVDARQLLMRALPEIVGRMTPSQMAQVQKVMDAAVVNPVIMREFDEAYKKIPAYPMGNQVYRDPRLVKNAYDISAKRIFITEADKRIKLDFEVLLTRDALKPVTDNPDEAKYLKKVKATLEKRGVWLRISQPWVRDPYDPSARILSPHDFEAWLSLGYDGDHIPTKNGRIDREALLATTLLGARYYEEVHNGPVQKALKKQAIRLQVEIEYGLQEHDRLIRRYRDAFPGVAEISDLLGGADLPSRSIWDYPHKMIVQALKHNVDGNVDESTAYLLTAAIATAQAAGLLEQYAEDSAAGAGRAITVLKVVKTAAQVAEVILTVTGIGKIAIEAGKYGLKRAVLNEIDDTIQSIVSKVRTKKPNALPDIKKEINFGYYKQPPGTKLGGKKGGQSYGAGTGFNNFP